MQKYKKLIKCIILLIVFIFITVVIKHYFKPFFSTVIILYLSHPIYKFLYKNKVFSDKINAILSILFVNLFILMIILLLGNFIFNKLSVFMSCNNELIFENKTMLHNFHKIFNMNNLIDEIKIIYNNICSNEFIKKGAFYTTEGIFAYFIGNIIVYFALTDKKLILKVVKDFIGEKTFGFLINKLRIINNIIKIELILVVITTIQTIIGFLILDIKYAVVLGLVCGLLDLIPYIGTIIVFIPLIVYKIYYKQYIIAVGLICLYVLVNINRQIMETKFMSNKLKIHPLLIIISSYIGIKFFGMIGLLMGPLYIVVIKEVILT
ncbi:AI-2E family transporter [Haloimpatiens sp. FM7330]|uniref:AI-2E family transporter n=1 Tax=Haloimpatiens sp. FM7330 TaxID=3298610 RepID=UPI003627AB27